ncbi:hypothetical protein Ddye_013431 [Dipteronia dyeriana]|uniref:Protein FAR1-RELATED SEQUENCE n=1 Tax=Dipteronia dyeriana TaxID=168575 RepID=A0AAE0CJM1_9ROSI|nr:hypothetical protein Ddye_013431 [Dipteronia dyeriana]
MQLHKCFRRHVIDYAVAKNAAQHISSSYGKPEFKKQFNKCFYGCHSEREFQASWNDMISTFELQDHECLKKLFELQEKWCPIFTMDTFSANIKSTQRSESTNNVFRQISTRTMDLINFIHHYEKKTKEMRLAELEEDYRCKYNVHRLKVRSKILAL